MRRCGYKHKDFEGMRCQECKGFEEMRKCGYEHKDSGTVPHQPLQKTKDKE